jgi:hypothetical protein
MTQPQPIREQVACVPKILERVAKGLAPVPLSDSMLRLVGGGLPKRGWGRAK